MSNDNTPPTNEQLLNLVKALAMFLNETQDLEGFLLDNKYDDALETMTKLYEEDN